MAITSAGDELPPVGKISISGPTLSSIIQRFASSSGDIDGLLIGHVTRLPPSDPHDDGYGTSPPPFSDSPVGVSITGHLSFGPPSNFFDSFGRVSSATSAALVQIAGDNLPPPTVVGWFSGRRRSPLRPSMRERAVSASLFKTLTLSATSDPSTESSDLSFKPSLFLLLSSYTTSNQAVHTHEYRAFVFRLKAHGGGALEARSLDVVNVGPAFRGQYGSFAPESSFPWMPCGVKGVRDGEAEAREKKTESSDTVGQSAAAEQRLLASTTEDFGMEKLGRLVGCGASAYTADLEGMYRSMLHKLESLARQVEKSSAMVLEQEKHNTSLRSKIAGLE